MGKKRSRWLVLAVSVVAVAAAAALAASAYGGSKAGGIIIDGTTGTVVNIDPANEYDYDSFTVDLLMYQGLYGFPDGAKLKPVLATGCSHSKNLKTWTCQLRHNVKFSRRCRDDVGRREVLVRPGAGDQGRPGHLDAAERPPEHVDAEPVHRHLPPEVAVLDLAVHPVDERRLHRREGQVSRRTRSSRTPTSRISSAPARTR